MYICFFVFFNDTATTEIYTLSLHDALPISVWPRSPSPVAAMKLRTALTRRRNRLTRTRCAARPPTSRSGASIRRRSEEHTSELQSRQYLVCRLLLEKKKNLRHSRHTFNFCR